MVITQKKINGYLQKYEYQVEYKENIDEIFNHLESHYNYIQELFNQYPTLCMVSEELLKIYKYSQSTTLDVYNEFHLDAKFCDYLILPNRTHNSAGGGDYEIKRTPIRIEQFLSFSLKIINALQCSIKEITDLREKVFTYKKLIEKTDGQ